MNDKIGDSGSFEPSERPCDACRTADCAAGTAASGWGSALGWFCSRGPNDDLSGLPAIVRADAQPGRQHVLVAMRRSAGGHCAVHQSADRRGRALARRRSADPGTQMQGLGLDIGPGWKYSEFCSSRCQRWWADQLARRVSA